MEKGGASSCHVSHSGSALPTPPAHGMDGRFVTGAQPLRLRGVVEGRITDGRLRRKTINKHQCLYFIVHLQREIATVAKKRLCTRISGPGRWKCAALRAHSETTSNASKKSDFSGWLVFTRESTKATFLASYLGWDSIVQGCLALGSPPKQTVERSRE